jgi:hypothetical protein
MGEALAQLVVGHLGDFPEQREWHVGADDGGRLKQSLCGTRQPIDARGQYGMHARWDLDRGHGLGWSIGSGFPSELLRLDQHLNALFEKERVAICSLDQQPFALVERWIGA